MLPRFLGALAFFQGLERFAKRLHVGFGLAIVQFAAFILRAGVLRFFLGDRREITAGVEIGNDLLGVGFFLHQRSEEHTSELQSHSDLVCRLLLEKKKKKMYNTHNVRDQILYT